MALAVSWISSAVLGGRGAGQWVTEVRGVYFSVKSKNPPDSSTRSTAPVVRVSRPRTAHPTSAPGIASSTSARLSYRKASSKAEGSSSSRSTRLTP